MGIHTVEKSRHRDDTKQALTSSWGESTTPACHSADPRNFFPAHGLSLGEAQIRVAKKICATCPVREDCLALAVLSGETDGIWGGTTPTERRRLKLQLRSLEESGPKVRALAMGRPVDIRPLDRPAVVVHLMRLGWDAERIGLALRVSLYDVEAARAQGARALEFQRLFRRHYPEGWE